MHRVRSSSSGGAPSGGGPIADGPRDHAERPARRLPRADARHAAALGRAAGAAAAVCLRRLARAAGGGQGGAHVARHPRKGARPVLQAEWGFEPTGGSRGGVAALLWGPHGVGKHSAVAAMAFDLGRPLRQVHFAQLLGGGGTGKGGREAVGLLFREARLADAVLLISGLESGGGAHGEGSREEERALALLLHEMARFPGVVALTCASAVPFDAAVHTLSPELVRALKAVVRAARRAAARRRAPHALP
eukprot:2592994-Prymnesium_polylepis.1